MGVKDLSCSVGLRFSSDLAWLWHRPAAVVPIQPVAWELPYVVGAALKGLKKKKKAALFFSPRPRPKSLCFNILSFLFLGISRTFALLALQG